MGSDLELTIYQYLSSVGLVPVTAESYCGFRQYLLRFFSVECGSKPRVDYLMYLGLNPEINFSSCGFKPRGDFLNINLSNYGSKPRVHCLKFLGLNPDDYLIRVRLLSFDAVFDSNLLRCDTKTQVHRIPNPKTQFYFVLNPKKLE